MNGREHKPQNICVSKPEEGEERNCSGLSNLPDVSLKGPKEFLSLCLPNPASPWSLKLGLVATLQEGPLRGQNWMGRGGVCWGAVRRSSI